MPFVMVLLMWYAGHDPGCRRAYIAYERELAAFQREKALVNDRALWEERAEAKCLRLPQVQEDENPGMRWERVIERLAKKCHVGVGRGLKASPIEDDHGGVWEVPVEVKFDNTSLQRLVEFLYAVNTAEDAMMDVRELEVSVRGENAGALYGKLELTCAYQKGKVPGEDERKEGRSSVRRGEDAIAYDKHSRRERWFPMLQALCFGTGIGIEAFYKMKREHLRELRRGVHARAYREVVSMTNRVALIDRYEDRSTCSLEMLKLVSDSLPADDDGMVFESFRFRRGESVFVRGKASQRESWRQLEQALRAAQVPRSGAEDADVAAQPLFADVNPSDSPKNREGMFPFSIEAKFLDSEKDFRQ